ncbi:DUF6232 family protein [Actinoplanes sp. NPDC051411]|uniref:DUF6232 family protein n=1 Tax=Actinoplanes sp. NPDC051411 TaxID=3155522 RepID=UPI003421831B
MAKHNGVEVRISRRTMWVGEKVYPLQAVSSVEPLEIVPRRGRIVARYLRKAGAWLGLGILGLMVVSCAGNTLPPSVVTVYELGVLAGLVASTVHVIRRLARSTLYILSIYAAGRPQEVVASWDKNQVFQLRDQVVAAIDDPSVNYAVHIDHVDGDFHLGDQYGDRFTGNKIVN